jgi:2-oxoglutarate dehydrogenase E1 component
MQFGSEFFRANFTYITEIYLNYKQNPSSVDSSWKQFFEDLSDDDKALMEEIRHEQSAVIGKRNELSSLPVSDIQEIYKQESDQEKKKQAAIKLLQKENINIGNNGNLEGATKNLLNNFRSFGHLVTDIDPLNIAQKSTLKELEINFSQQELNTPISIMGRKDTVQNHINFFKNIYTSKKFI